MDIKAILSPSEEAPSTERPPAAPSNPNSPRQSAPHRAVQRALSGPGTQPKHQTSPLTHSMVAPNLPAHVLSPSQTSLSSPLISPVPTPSGNSHILRSTSTQSMDTLTDLASMQNHQPGRPAPFKHASFESLRSSDSIPRFSPAVQSSLTSANVRASFDINMVDISKQTKRTDFSATSIPAEKQERARELALQLEEHPSAYTSHVELVDILHQGLVDHIYPSSDPGSRRDPKSYDLLSDLRAARESMEKLFAVGETVWTDWLQDESILAQTAEERIAVVEKCRRAVEEEAGSVQLWSAYGDWVLHCYNWATSSHPEAAPDEEILVGKEIFTWQMVLETWQEAAEQTAYDLSSSHVIWDKYLSIRAPDVQQRLSREQVGIVMRLLTDRLQMPHANWDGTFQTFSTFISANFPSDQYEGIMSDTLRSASEAKKKWSLRESHEVAVQQGQREGDRDAEYTALVKYIEWEQTPDKRRRLDMNLAHALYQRAEQRFPADASLWDEHVNFFLENPSPKPKPYTKALDVLEQACKHCPWSGLLWSKYLLISDRQGCSFSETEAIKHKATSSGVLEAAGIEETFKVHAAWCSYLRRRAFGSERDEDDLDIAEIGIKSSIESVNSLGAKLGLEDTADPSFRLHRIYINFLSESGRWDSAKQEFDKCVHDYGKSWEFWSRFYHWEMMRWRRFTTQVSGNESHPVASPPGFATAVLKRALDQASLDYPEPVIQLYLNHCEDYEDAEELQIALLKVQKVQKALAARRQLEAVQATVAEVAQHQDPSGPVGPSDWGHSQGAKRKRDDGFLAEGSSHSKKTRHEDVPAASIEAVQPEDPSRDRENATILVERLPEGVTETRIRQYFSNCGRVRTLRLLENESSALVEFDDDGAARYALSRNGQTLDDSIISVALDTGSTVYLTNYQAAADESYVRRLLDRFGEILSVRFPSLQGNKRRRFCYVQFKIAVDAQEAASTIDGQDVDGLPIVCKISNPAVKKSRSDSKKAEINNDDGRTIFVGRLNFKATEKDVRKAFQPYGTVELVRMPLHETMKNRNKGIAFITFSTRDEAWAALEMNGQTLREMQIKVEIASDDQAQGRRKGSTANGRTKSATPSHVHEQRLRDCTNSPSAASATSFSAPGGDRKDRTVWITGIPDTVNEDRVRAIAAPFGELKRVILKTNHQGAVLEYTTIAAAGEAALQLDGFAIDATAGRKLVVVDEKTLLAQRPERKAEGFGSSDSQPKFANPKGTGRVSGVVNRPKLSNIRPRRGGNLGQRNVALHGGPASMQYPTSAGGSVAADPLLTNNSSTTTSSLTSTSTSSTNPITADSATAATSTSPDSQARNDGNMIDSANGSMAHSGTQKQTRGGEQGKKSNDHFRTLMMAGKP